MIISVIDPVLGIVSAGGIAALGAYLAAARKMSGAVKSSDAEQLWTESRSIREWSADRIAQLTGIIGSLETRVKAVEERNESLQDENKLHVDTIADLRDELRNCRTACEMLAVQLAQANEKVDDLEEEAEEEVKPDE